MDPGKPVQSPEEKAQKIFGERADFYVTSAVHTDPVVLERVVSLAAPLPNALALDVATGTGHTAFALAPHVRFITGTDLTQEMINRAEHLRMNKSVANVAFQLADVHQLPFKDGVFDLVTCRRAAHHFSSIELALKEMRRVLKFGGKLVIDDRSVPEDDGVDRCMNLLDTYHDESHVREYRASEWRRMIKDAGFTVEIVEPYIRHRPLSSLTRDVSEENLRKIEATIAALTPSQREIFNLVEVEGELWLNHWFVLVSASVLDSRSAGETVWRS